jgi:hypothetical protein
VGSSGTCFLAVVRFDAAGVRDDAVRVDVDDDERLRVVELLRRRRPGMGSDVLFWRGRGTAMLRRNTDEIRPTRRTSGALAVHAVRMRNACSMDA